MRIFARSNWNFFTSLLLGMISTDETEVTGKYLRVEGLPGRFNNVYYCEPLVNANLNQNNRDYGKSQKNENDEHPDIVCYFGGDIQNYRTQMSEEYAARYSREYCLESIGHKLARHRFAHSAVMTVQPVAMYRRTFSRFSNFFFSADSSSTLDQFGTPVHGYVNTRDSLSHLERLIVNIWEKRVQLITGADARNDNEVTATTVTPPHGQVNKFNDVDGNEGSGTLNQNRQLSIAVIGFSKGGTVLNQLIYSLVHTRTNNFPTTIRLTQFYLLDTGHNGESGFWITDSSVIESLSKYASIINKPIRVSIGSTAFQLEYKQKSRISNEERRFRELVQEFSKDLETGRELLKLSRVYLDGSTLGGNSRTAEDYLRLHFSIIDELVKGNL